MRTHYGPWQPCWISNQHQKHKSSRGSSNEHFWQVWFNSVQWFQRRRFKCEKLTHGRTLIHDKNRWAKKKNKGLHRARHDTTEKCWQGKIKQVYIKCVDTAFCWTVICRTHGVLDICLDLLFQVLKMPSKYVTFRNLGRLKGLLFIYRYLS